MKVKMTKEQYARWQESEAARVRLEEARKRRLEEQERLEQTFVLEMGDVWQSTAYNDKTRWPLINHATLVPKGVAYSTKVEWVTGGVPLSSGSVAWPQGSIARADYNYTNIFRVPWAEWISNAELASSRYGGGILGSPSKRREKMDEMLDQIEYRMRAGIRHSSPLTAGGVPSLLGRWPHKRDFVQFRVLRDMSLRRYPHPNYTNSDRDARCFQFEYLIETSWIAYRKGN